MPNLLYVNSDVLSVLRQHKAYQFWSTIMLNMPVRHVIPEERVFHPRKIKVENGGIYLTIDMKFVYCRDKLFSFLYVLFVYEPFVKLLRIHFGERMTMAKLLGH